MTTRRLTAALEHARPTLTFWAFQGVAWTAYGLALMLPWLGEFSIRMMLPTKVVIAGTGLLVSAGLRELIRHFDRPPRDRVPLAAAVVAASMVGGVVWERMLAGMIDSSPTTGLRHLGALDGGMPGLAGAAYHALVLMAWSAMYLTVRAWRSRPADIAAQPAASAHILAQDGNRSVLLRPHEIDWVEAAGDYVRVHIGVRRLLIRTTMRRFAAQLAEYGHVRIHRSTVVNVDRVREVVRQGNNQYLVHLNNGTTLRASRNYSDKLKDVLARSVTSRPPDLGTSPLGCTDRPLRFP
jgi:hypothetical protein